MKQDRKNAETLFESLSLNLPAMAQVIKKKGRGRDTVLAHITPEEAKLLKKRGGRGSINPDTGLLEFEDFYKGEYMGAPDFSFTGAGTTPTYDTGGGYDPVTGTGGGVDWSTGSAIAYPDTYTPSTSYAPGIDLSSYTGPGVSTYAGAPGVQVPQIQDLGVGSLGTRAAIPSGMPDTFGAAPEAAPTPTQYGTQEQQSILDKIEKATGMNREMLAKLGIGTLQTLGGVAATTRAAKQGQQAKKEQQAIATPYQARGQELVGKAERGELTPVGQQQLSAAQAQIQQGIESRGGVGAAQAATQIEAFRQQLLQQQYDLGLKISGIGDQIALGAIKTGMEADRYVNELANSYFTNIARTIYGQAAPAPRTITIG